MLKREKTSTQSDSFFESLHWTRDTEPPEGEDFQHESIWGQAESRSRKKKKRSKLTLGVQENLRVGKNHQAQNKPVALTRKTPSREIQASQGSHNRSRGEWLSESQDGRVGRGPTENHAEQGKGENPGRLLVKASRGWDTSVLNPSKKKTICGNDNKI